MRIVLASTFVPFVHGGARFIVEWAEDKLREAGHEVERFYLPFLDAPHELMDQMAAFRLMDLAQWSDRLVAFRPPAYAIPHPDKVLWFIHHIRTFYDLWDSPFAPAKTPDTRVGDLAIVNTGATVDHDGDLGEACHVAPRCGLAGNVTVVSTDHVSWSEDRKTDPNMLKNASGVPGLEVIYALLLKGLDERRLPFTFAAMLLAQNPAKLFRIDHQKGALSVGRDADIVLARRDPYRYQAAASGNNFVSWSPYEGIELPYRVVGTFVRRDCVAADGKVLAKPGQGRFVRPPLKH